ncbi:hypothetical protein CFE70_008418 [Pyrenophora teres f. teres 0-1]
MASQAQLKKQQGVYTLFEYESVYNGKTIASKIGDIEQEAEEHKLVLETLQPLSGDRKCFRMINGVLTERTVKEVVPILQTNSDGLKKALEELVKQYKLKQDEMEKWKVRLPFRLWECKTDLTQKKNNVQVVQQPGQ